MRIEVLYPRYRFAIRSLLALTLLIGILNLAVPLRVVEPVLAESVTTATADLRLRSESQLKTEAGLFQTAINEIGRIGTLKITSNKELAAANQIVEKHLPNLKFARSKLIALGLSDSTFVSAVKRKGVDKAATEAFGVELVKEPSSILKVSGGQALGDRMRSTLAADTARIRQAAAVLKKASDDLKAKQGHHAWPTNKSCETSEPMDPLAVDLSASDVVFLAIVVAVIAFPPLGVVLVNLATGAVVVGAAVSLVTAAATLLANLVKNAGTDEGRDEVAACLDTVDRRYRRCRDAANDLGIFAEVAKAACYADWLLATAACWIS